MKNNEEKKNGKEIMSNILNKASDIGKKVADNVQKGTQALAEKAKISQHDYKMKKYNPLFPKEFKSKNFHLPNIIQIVDDATRRDVDVCQGAMGWREKINGTEVLFLYDEVVQTSGVQFVPAVTCDAIYYVDNFDRTKYIKTDCVFSKAHEERLAELEHIAYCLGAKSCSIEIIETNKESTSASKKIGGSIASKAVSTNQHFEGYSSNKSQLNGKTTSNFEGNSQPQRPTLKWFAYDENVKNLIEMRFSQNNTIKSRELQLAGASSATMSQSTAITIDAILFKKKNSSALTMESQATREHLSKLIYTVEF